MHVIASALFLAAASAGSSIAGASNAPIAPRITPVSASPKPPNWPLLFEILTNAMIPKISATGLVKQAKIPKRPNTSERRAMTLLLCATGDELAGTGIGLPDTGGGLPNIGGGTVFN